MFRKAIKGAQQYTKPVVLSYRKFNGETDSAIGTYIVLNEDGWILTALHLLEQVSLMVVAKAMYAEFLQQRQDIQNNQRYSHDKKESELNKLSAMMPKDLVTDFSVWLDMDKGFLDNIQGSSSCDLAIGQILNFDKHRIRKYPEFVNLTGKSEVGTNLCKLGYPLHEIKPIYNENGGDFTFPQNSMSFPIFPIEGIYTRKILGENGTTKLVETSTPGLKGQSGGPIIDKRGRIWAMQSETRHYSLGFTPPDPDKPGAYEHQFLNCGVGVHVDEITKFLRQHGVKFQQQSN